MMLLKKCVKFLALMLWVGEELKSRAPTTAIVVRIGGWKPHGTELLMFLMLDNTWDLSTIDENPMMSLHQWKPISDLSFSFPRGTPTTAPTAAWSACSSQSRQPIFTSTTREIYGQFATCRQHMCISVFIYCTGRNCRQYLFDHRTYSKKGNVSTPEDSMIRSASKEATELCDDLPDRSTCEYN